MDATRPVAMHVHRVPLTEALETLAAVTDSRWRLGYLFASDPARVKGALDTIASGQRPEGWKNFDVPLFGRPSGLDDSAFPPDPRIDVWNVREPGDKNLHGYLQAAALGVSATFSCPEDFNPAVNKAPASGEIRNAAQELAKSAGAKVEEVFLLLGRPAGIAEAERRPEDDTGPFDFRPGRGPAPTGGGSRGGPPAFDRELMRQRQLAEIEKLPKSEQAAAREEFEARDKFFSSLYGLPEDERRKKVEEYFNSPENQERMMDRRLGSEERKTPQQRLERYQRYVQKKQQAMNSKDK
jgi:hypothetical protein